MISVNPNGTSTILEEIASLQVSSVPSIYINFFMHQLIPCIRHNWLQGDWEDNYKICIMEKVNVNPNFLVK